MIHQNHSIKLLWHICHSYIIKSHSKSIKPYTHLQITIPECDRLLDRKPTGQGLGWKPNLRTLLTPLVLRISHEALMIAMTLGCPLALMLCASSVLQDLFSGTAMDNSLSPRPDYSSPCTRERNFRTLVKSNLNTYLKGHTRSDDI